MPIFSLTENNTARAAAIRASPPCSPYISTYGSCTATLEHSPGTCVGIFLTYLTQPLVARMNETEGGYNVLRLDGVGLHVAEALDTFRQGGPAWGEGSGL